MPLQLWLVSAGGFTGETLAYLSSREDIYASDYDGINNIFQAFGGNYTIPVFYGTADSVRNYLKSWK